jgi:hypothetical protein
VDEPWEAVVVIKNYNYTMFSCSTVLEADQSS